LAFVFNQLVCHILKVVWSHLENTGETLPWLDSLEI